MEIVKLSFDILSSAPDIALGVHVRLDGNIVLTTDHVKEKISFDHGFSDDDGDHKLEIVIFGKTSDHTKVDADNNIIQDAVLHIQNFVVDELDFTQLFCNKCVYTHSFNGTQPEIQDTFHGIAGCNGVISLKFTTPIYLWLLENM